MRTYENGGFGEIQKLNMAQMRVFLTVMKRQKVGQGPQRLREGFLLGCENGLELDCGDGCSTL